MSKSKLLLMAVAVLRRNAAANVSRSCHAETTNPVASVAPCPADKAPRTGELIL